MESPGGLPELSNCYCHPGRAGGLPALGQDFTHRQFDAAPERVGRHVVGRLKGWPPGRSGDGPEHEYDAAHLRHADDHVRDQFRRHPRRFQWHGSQAHGQPLDLNALARHTPEANLSYEFGYAQKTRSPNLCERYSWSRIAMALEMNNFVGYGNDYLGNPGPKPEVAPPQSLTGEWRSGDGATEFKLTPYYTRVSNYIDTV